MAHGLPVGRGHYRITAIGFVLIFINMLDSELFKILVNDLDPLKVAFFGAIGVIFSLNGIADYL